MRVRVRADARPTEDLKKVVEAIRNIYTGELRIIDEGDGYYVIEGSSTDKATLDKLYNLLRIEQVLSAARAVMQRRAGGNRIRLILHKQAAYVGKVSFIDNDRESPMGGIIIEIETENPEEFINWLAPEVKPSPRRSRSASRSKRARRRQELRKAFKDS